MAKPKRAGRKRGSRNKGYFYRDGRGWFTKNKQCDFIPLTGENGQRLRDEQADSQAAKLSYARWLTLAKEQPAPVDAEPCATVLEVCQAYLAKAKESKGENKTFTDRAESLFDFVYGLPAKFRGVDLTSKGKPTKADKAHNGYGAMPTCQLKPLDVDQWLQAHSAGWKSSSTKRNHTKALIRALNYGVESGLIPANPIRGYKIAKVKARITYITPEQEAALCDAASPALAVAIKVLIRTGMRPGIEFAALAARHVRDNGQRIEIVFQPHETKTSRLRTIYVIDPETIATIRKQVAAHPSGPIFRTPRGVAWNQSNLSKRFRDVRDKLVKAGMAFDRDCVLYSTRHTYARRILHGYWNGKPTNIETLAKLMGNSPQICRAHYLQFDLTSTDLLWQSA